MTILVVIGCAVFFGLYVFVHHYIPLLLERFLRKTAGADDVSSWQPHARPQAALLFALLVFAPALRWLGTAWPTPRGLTLYGVYVSSLVTLTLVLSAYSRHFQRFVFRLHPIPSGVSRRFIFGTTFFLVLSLALTYLSFRLS